MPVATSMNRSPWLVAAALAFALGCTQAADEAADGARPADGSGDSSEGAAAGHNHLGSWCTAHGIPEHECSLCSADFAAECKAAGDWCDEHDRADSQCFVCHPELAAKFAAKYEAKFGEPPPPRIE